MQSSVRTPYDQVVMAVQVTIPYARYSIESAQWWIGRALKSLVDGAGITPRDIDGFCVSSFTAGTPRRVRLLLKFRHLLGQGARTLLAAARASCARRPPRLPGWPGYPPARRRFCASAH